jgi:AcrR family transcriptional regulator
MVAPPPSTPDAADSRARLLDAALRLFAEQGFAKTSIRQIAEAASVNTALISYYFGDKKGLYRATFTEPMGSPIAVDAWPGGAPPTLDAFIGLLIHSFMQPLHQGSRIELCMRLHFREMLDPTGLWQHELECEIKPTHMALTHLLCKELDLLEPDDDVHRLALAISALALQYYVGRDVVQAVCPPLVEAPNGLAKTTARLMDFARFMVAGERERRRSAHPATRQAAPPSPPQPR